MLCAEAEEHDAACAHSELHHGGSIGDYLLSFQPAAQEEIFRAVTRNSLHVVQNIPS